MMLRPIAGRIARAHADGAGAGALIVAGRPPNANDAFEGCDVQEDRWTELPTLPATYADRNHIAVTAPGGKLYLAGGRYDGGSFTDPRTGSLDIHDPASNVWTTGAPMLRPRGGVNGIAAWVVFLCGAVKGRTSEMSNDVFSAMDVYDPVNDRWTALPPLPTPVHGVTGAAFIDGLIDIPGGGTTSGGQQQDAPVSGVPTGDAL